MDFLNRACAGVAVLTVGVAIGAVYEIKTMRSVSGAQGTGERKVRTAAEQKLPQLNGSKLKATLVEVTYGLGAASAPHSHPCPVIGYVVSGELRFQVKGAAETTFRTGETFYEPPNGVHLVSANGSKTEAAKLLAIFLCDHEGELSTAPIETHDASH